MGEYTFSLLHNQQRRHEHEEDDRRSVIIRALIDRIQSEHEEDSHEEEDALEDQEDDHEMALSLCDLPLDNHDQELASPRTSSSHMISPRRSFSQPQEIFEFFSDLSSEMSSAEDMILCGRLVPFKDIIPPPPPPPPLPLPLPPHFLPPVIEPSKTRMGEENKEEVPLMSRQSGSVPGLNRSLTRSQSATKKSSSNKLMMRSSRSLDYRKLNRGLSNLSSCSSSSSSNSSHEPLQDEASTVRSSSMRSSVGESSFKSSNSIGGSKPRWFLLMFGVVKPPSYGTMELKDIKIRQSRRNPSTMFLPADISEEGRGRGGSRTAVAGKGSYSYRLLRVLSCKNHASVAVETSVYNMPHGV